MQPGNSQALIDPPKAAQEISAASTGQDDNQPVYRKKDD